MDSNRAYVNEQPKILSMAPIIYKNKTMIPLRFVGESFGESVDYNPDNRSINITMPKFTAGFLTREQAGISNIKNIEKVELLGNRRLMLSDNPETLNSNTIKEDNSTLWNDVVKENRGPVDHRVVGWHTNKFDKEVTIGITIENLSTTNTIEVRNLEGIHRTSLNSWGDYDIGLPISEAVLNNQLRNMNLSHNQVGSGETLLLGSFKLKPNELIGFLNDFTVVKTSGTGELNYIIRTVVSKDNSDLTTIKSNPIPIDQINLHSRGVWRGSELVAVLPTYNVQQASEVSYNISNGVTDNLLNANNSLVDNALSISNKGHYGVVYKVKIPYINKSNEEKTVRVRIGSRGGIYSGTVKTKDGVFNIASLKPNKDVVNVIDYITVENEGFIELDIMHAGGAYLPISINITTLK